MPQYTPKQLNNPSIGIISTQTVQKNLSPTYQAVSKKALRKVILTTWHCAMVFWKQSTIFIHAGNQALSINFVGDDGATYILDQIIDALTGVYSHFLFSKRTDLQLPAGLQG